MSAAYPLAQRRGLARIVEDGFAIYAEQAVPFLIVAAATLPTTVALQVVGVSDDVRGWLMAPLVLWADIFVSVLASAVIIAALGQIGEEGGRADLLETLRMTAGRFISLIGAWLRMLFHVMLFFLSIVGIPWGIRRFVRWILIDQVVILEGSAAKPALSRSADVVFGQWWRTLGVSIAIIVIVSAPSFIIRGPLYFAPGLVSIVVGSMLSAALMPFGAVAMTLLYFDLRTRHETMQAQSR